MICKNCQSKVPKDSQFCPNCGAKLGSSATSHQPRFSRPPRKYSGPKKLYRTRQDRLIAGVCGGFGDYFDIDSNIIRIIFLLFAPVSIWIYVFSIALIPESPYDPWGEPKKQRKPPI